MNLRALLFVIIGIVTLAPAALADDVKTERVHFDRGKSGTIISGAVRGYASSQYLIDARAGQTMSVTLESKSTSNFFNLFAPGKVPGQDEAMFAGDTGGSQFKGSLPASGDYLVQLYLYRNAARRNESAKFKLAVAITADGSSGGGSGGDALVPGTDFNATGNVSCARGAAQPMGNCKFGVKRTGGGNADVIIFWPGGGNRVISFANGEPISFDRSQADGDVNLKSTKNADLFIIEIGDQRFEIPEAVIFGG